MDQQSITSSKNRNPPIARELLWEGGTFRLHLPKRMRVRCGFIEHQYTRIWKNPRVDDDLVITFLHQSTESLLELYSRCRTNRKAMDVCCAIKVWRNRYEDGGFRFFLDYTPTTSSIPTRALRVIRFSDAGQWPQGLGGTIITISLPEQKGFIIIGDKT